MSILLLLKYLKCVLVKCFLQPVEMRYPGPKINTSICNSVSRQLVGKAFLKYNKFKFKFKFKFYLSHTRLYRDCITSSEM